VDKNENGISDDSEELYAQNAVEKDSDVDPTNFCTYWVEPNQDYIVVVEVDRTAELNEHVDDSDLLAGDKFFLNGGMEI
jgi:hypothetical protein